MAKKDFSSLTGQSVYNGIEKGINTAGTQRPASEAEILERRGKLQTQGRKGCKATRINMAFTPDNHEFIKIMAAISGMSITRFNNYVIEQYRADHPETFEIAKQAIDSYRRKDGDKEGGKE